MDNDAIGTSTHEPELSEVTTAEVPVLDVTPVLENNLLKEAVNDVEMNIDSVAVADDIINVNGHGSSSSHLAESPTLSGLTRSADSDSERVPLATSSILTHTQDQIQSWRTSQVDVRQAEVSHFIN